MNHQNWCVSTNCSGATCTRCLQSWKAALKNIEAAKPDVQQLKVAIASYLDKEFCSNVTASLHLANGVLKIIRQHATI
jgi:copper chaperone CopZ